MAELEDLVLSGKLFSGGSRSSSPERSPSPDAVKWPNDADYDSEQESRDNIKKALQSQGDMGQQDSIGMGPGRTGVKGVIRDRNEAETGAKSNRTREFEEMNKKMEKASLGGLTFLEEENLRVAEKARLEGTEDVLTFRSTKGKFGHLREVGLEGFLKSVEQEERGVWVVIHLYEPSLDRCIILDETLSRLARQYPLVKFLRARASALGFASTSTASTKQAPALPRSTKSSLMPGKYQDDEDDPYGDDETEEFEDEIEDDNVDTDMLPTLLVYQSGDLVYNWVRVDWEAGRGGIEEFLKTHRVLFDPFSNGNCGLPSDDEDDITFSDDE